MQPEKEGSVTMEVGHAYWELCRQIRGLHLHLRGAKRGAFWSRIYLYEPRLDVKYTHSLRSSFPDYRANS